MRKNTNLSSVRPLTISAQDGLVDQTTYFHKQIASKQLANYILVLNGEFAYNKSYSVGYPYGAIKRLNKYDKGVLSTLYIVFKPKNINSDFLEQYYDSSKWYSEIYRNAAEGARNHGLLNISATDFFKSNLSIPKDIGEQKQIGNLLLRIDRILSLYQRKLNLLKQLKKGLLQKTLADQNKEQPILRFKNFNNKWGKYKLVNCISKEIKGKAKATMLGGENIYLETEYLNGGIAKKIDSPNNVSKDDVIILWDGSQAGKLYYGFSGALGSTLKAFTPKISGLFLYQYMSKDQNKIYQLYRTPNIPHVIKNFTQQYSIRTPNPAEQNQIGSFLERVDMLISLYQHKLNTLTTLKKFLLQQMFI